MYNYALIGNCQCSALIHKEASIDWLCMPRPDDPPVFGRLLDEGGGSFSVEMPDLVNSTQDYLPNTNVLQTKLEGKHGTVLITDFFPRFEQFGRMFRPMMLLRKIEVVTGSPSLILSCNPISGWAKESVKGLRVNSHLRFDIRDDAFRITTNASLTHFTEKKLLLVQETLYFVLSWGSSFEEDLANTFGKYERLTIDYWRTWVKHCSIPPLFQKEVIRSALALKMHVFEDTGAILAATTTSLPEEIKGERNWDYRYCWLRDAYYVLTAFQNLGHFEEMEGFLKFLIQILHDSTDLKPVYKIDHSHPLPELRHENWKGFGSSRPVRSGNQAAEHIQNDVYGEMILAIMPIFIDERFMHLRTENNKDLLIKLADFCISSLGRPDAGLWELRGHWQEHSFTYLMCWAGLDRVIRLHESGKIKVSGIDTYTAARDRALKLIEKSIREGVVTNGPDDSTVDASLLQLPLLHYPSTAVSAKTVTTIRSLLAELSKNGDGHDVFLYRYARKDDFGAPQSAFLICSFWLIQAMAKTGHPREELQKMLKNCLKASNHVGLFSEHFNPQGPIKQLGNFPQAYSHVGWINAAFAVSPKWDEIF